MLELADDAGAYVGRLLAGAGAEVTKVQPQPRPYGWWSIDPDRTVGEYLGKSKQTVPIRTDDPGDQRKMRDLLASTDVVIESGHPGSLTPYGISAEAVIDQLPHLIWVRITPFGTDGPRAQQLGSDLVCAAVGGFLTLAGYPDGPPIRAYGDQALRMAALHAATGVALALYEREGSQRGQLVDVSVQEAVSSALENALQYYDLEQVVRNRNGHGYTEAGSGLFTCRGGLVYLMAGRLSTAAGWANLVAWLRESGAAGAEDLADAEWEDFIYRVTPAAEQFFRQVFEGFASRWTATELYHEAQRRGIVLCPVSKPSDLIDDAQLAAREFFTRPEPDGDWLIGPPFRVVQSTEPAAVATDRG